MVQGRDRDTGDEVMLTRTVLQTRITGRLVNRGCTILESLWLSTGLVVIYRTKAGKVKRKTLLPYKVGTR